MVQNTAALPSNFPEYFNGGDVGILPEQNMFAYDSSLDGLWNARASFCGMLNYILNSNSITYDRPDAVAAMSVTTPIDEYLIWRRADTTQYIEPIPPKTLWDIEVFSIEERNHLLIDPTINTNILNGEKIRVLVNGIGNEQAPQWSVYEASVANLHITANALNIASNPNTIFNLAKSYDFHVSTIAARNLLITAPVPIQVGQYVLVDGNTSTNNFWTVWKYYGPSSGQSGLDAHNFQLVRYQTYDTSDFWEYTDWYASGYSIDVPPVVVYANAKERNNAENPNPKTTFVKINDDGTGVWNWTAYVTDANGKGSWIVVARQNGTIQVSSKFYDKVSRPLIGFNPISLSDIANIPNRDGSWEFRVIFEMLRDVPILTNIEINELFFSMLNFVHTQQDQVDWAFKTSFMNIGGYNQLLSQTPIQPVDNITNLTNYITEIKPYRVVIRNFDQVITPPLDNASIHATDFDFPPYVDSSSKYRTIEPTSITNLAGDVYLDNSSISAADLSLINNSSVYTDWLNNYKNTGIDPKNYQISTWNPVRHFKITQLFDRVDHMPKVYEGQFEFTTHGSLANVRSFVLKTFKGDLSNFIVEVFVADNKIDSSKFTVSGNIVSISSSLNDGDSIYIVVRQNLTTNLAADRIQQFYDPANASTPEKNLRQILGLDFKSNILDGGNLNDNSMRDYDIDGRSTGVTTDETLNPNSKYYGLMDPSIDKNRPEELIVTHPNESVNFFIMDDDLSNSYTMSQALPYTDLMAPYQTGDYDAAPLDSVRLDVDFVQATTNATQRIQNVNSVVERQVFVIRNDAWEDKLFPTPNATLIADAYANSASILIQPHENGVFPFTPPRIEYVSNGTANTTVQSIITHPGAVWLNNERIEYFDYTINANGTVSLNQLKRGTRSTRIGCEQRTVITATGDGQNNGTGTKTFLIPEITSINDVEVYQYTVPLNSNNTPIIDNGYQYTDANGVTSFLDQYTGYQKLVPKIRNIDYTANVVSNGVAVTFTSPPMAGINIYLCQTTGVYHPVGSVLRDALIDSFGQVPLPTESLQWITASGSLLTASSNSTVNTRILASDSLGKTITYSLYSGNLPSGIHLNNSGTITGIANTVQTDTTYSFVANASANGNTITRAFNITVSAPEIITWVSDPNLGTYSYAGAINYSNALVAQENHGHSVTYSLSSQNSGLPNGITVSNSGVFNASLPSLTYPNSETFSVIVNAVSSGAGFQVTNAQTFSVTFAAENPLSVCAPAVSDGAIVPVNLSNGTTTFGLPRTYTGTIPNGVNSLQVKLWGGASSGYWYYGGASGGFTNGIFNVNPGDQIKIEIGKTGSQGFTSYGTLFPQTAGSGGWPDGGDGGIGYGGGGGSSRLWINNTVVAIAGGAGGITNASGNFGITNGGGLTGSQQAYYSLSGIGRFGSQTEGGYIIFDGYHTDYASNQSQNAPYPNHQGGYLMGGKGFEGNTANAVGGGGGGGYYGGAGGLGREGGGGSGYIDPSANIGATLTGPFIQDADYPGGGVSLGGNGTGGNQSIPGSCGGNGFAVLKLYNNVFVPNNASVSSPKVVLSTRKVIDNYSGYCMQIMRISDNATMDIGFSSNILDVSSIASFCGTSDGVVNIWYDQSGNGLNATYAHRNNGFSQYTQRPIIYTGGSIITTNGLPSIRFSTNNQTAMQINYSLFTGAFTFSSTVKMNSIGSQMALALTEMNNPRSVGIFFNSSGNPQIFSDNSSADSTYAMGTLAPSIISFTSNHGIEAIGGNISASTNFNGSPYPNLNITIGNTGGSYPVSNVSYIGAFINDNAYPHDLYYLDANVSEIVYWDGPLSSADLTAYKNKVQLDFNI